MSKITDIQSLIDEARTVQGRVTGDYRRFQDSLVSTRHKIKKTFSGNTQANMMDLHEKKARRDLFRTIQNETNQYRDSLKKGKAAAEELIHSAAKPPAQETIDRFDRSMSNLKTELLLATNPETAKRLLIDFVGSVSDPFLAERVRSEYAALVQPIIAGSGIQAPRYKNNLANAFQQLRDATLTDEGKAATQLLQTIEAMSASAIYPSIVRDKVAEHFGRSAAAHVHEPEGYFQDPDFAGDADLPLRDLNMLALTLQQAQQ